MRGLINILKSGLLSALTVEGLNRAALFHFWLALRMNQHIWIKTKILSTLDLMTAELAHDG